MKSDLSRWFHIKDLAEAFQPFYLTMAALYGRVNAVKALLKAGVDVNVKSGRMDWPGFLTPLDTP